MQFRKREKIVIIESGFYLQDALALNPKRNKKKMNRNQIHK